MKRFFLITVFVILLVIPVLAVADCQCVQPNEGQTGFSAATCTEPAYYYLECLDCGGQWKEKARDKLGHDYQYAMTNPAFCETDGKEWYECTRCGDTEYQTIPATGHQWEYISRIPPTCTTAGQRNYECTNRGCEETKKEEIAATDHSWKSTSENLPTCVKAGYETFECENCHETKQETLNPTGKHEYTIELSRTDPTCTKDGQKVMQCEYCSAEKTETVYSGGHNWSIVSTTPATCDKAKIVHSECKKCGEKKEQTVGSAAGHSWKDDQVIKAATCTEDGKASSKCSVCGKTEKERTIPKLGHSWSETKVTTAATCEKAGESEQTCKNCGEKKTVEVKAKGHSWGEWKITVKATSSKDGTRERVCKTCNEKQTETYKATSSEKPSEPKETKKPSSSSVKRDDVTGVQVVTTASKVNLRSGPGKDNKRVNVTGKKNSNLGDLLDAQVDKNGTVWFQVEYKNKECWIMADFAEAVVGEIDFSETRKPDKNKKELTGYYLRSFEFAAEDFGLEENPETDATEYYSDVLRISGLHYIEELELTGEGYTLYGIEVGDKRKDVLKKLKKANLLLDGDGNDECTYRVPVSPYSLSADEEGFDGVLVVTFDEDDRVESILLRAEDVPEE